MIAMAISSLFPTIAGATPETYYDLGEGNSLYMAALVCKIENCFLEATNDDLYNYSDYSANPEMAGGLGETLTASPGDNLTFLGLTRVEGNTSINPIFGVSFTNAEYLENLDIFGSGMGDLDLDTNAFEYSSPEAIILSNGLDTTMDAEIGSISARIKSDVPDQTVITGTFYVVGPDAERIAGVFDLDKAKAEGEDTYLSSTVRIVVNNPATPATTTTITALPETGPQNPVSENKWLVLGLLAGLMIIVPVSDRLLKKYRK
jgi:hypothetical protein